MYSIILFAHGARDPEWARPLEQLREAVLGFMPQADVRTAYLEFMQPGLGEALDAVAQAGATHVKVIPVFLSQGGHVRRDVPLILDAARQRHPQLEIDLREALGESPGVIEALARAALREA